MRVEPLDGLPALPDGADAAATAPDRDGRVPVPDHRRRPGGLSAAIELGKARRAALLVDDKHRLGGKLVLQTHRFFGSIEACHAGTRGIDIARSSRRGARTRPSEVWLNSHGARRLQRRKVGVLRGGDRYVLVARRPAGGRRRAREVARLPGNTLPGVYGAGAFQTLVNRDLVRPAERLFVVGGGNVGLIAAYHALQAGIEVVGLCEALPECGGYKVHKDKLARWACRSTPRTPSSREGGRRGRVRHDRAVDAAFRRSPAPSAPSRATPCSSRSASTRSTSSPRKAQEFGMPCSRRRRGGDRRGVGRDVLRQDPRPRDRARAGRDVGEVPAEWHRTAEVLKSKPARSPERPPAGATGVFPVFHCSQEIPCNPCTSVCPQGTLIYIDPTTSSRAELRRATRRASASAARSASPSAPAWPSRWWTTARTRAPDRHDPLRVPAIPIKKGDVVTVLDTEGAVLGNVEVTPRAAPEGATGTLLVKVRGAGRDRQAHRRHPGAGAVGGEPMAGLRGALDRRRGRLPLRARDGGRDPRLIRRGYRDMNEIKAVTRAGMGACGGKTCPALIKRLFREEGIPPPR
jgi:sarcosine oxidase, subunit alpha